MVPAQVVDRQIGFLRQRGFTGAVPAARAPAVTTAGVAAAAASPTAPVGRSRGNVAASGHLAALAERYARRTAASKRRAADSRGVLADNRASAGFSLPA